MTRAGAELSSIFHLGSVFESLGFRVERQGQYANILADYRFLRQVTQLLTASVAEQAQELPGADCRVC